LLKSSESVENAVVHDARASAAPAPAAVECIGVAKRFYVYEHRTTTLQEFVMRSLRRQPPSARRASFQISALDLYIAQGESIALVGANGSGKSTALRLMAGIYPLTEGRIVVRGRLVAVIELGATFQPELTGAENVELYAAALGFRRREIAATYPTIVAFADIDEFMQVPVKYYSSGMRTRLAFAVAICADPDILLLDEVLAVGDESFRERCLTRLEQYHAGGGTLIVVSHDLWTVRRLCARAVWMENGRVRMTGEVNAVLDEYEAASRVG
jgi:ABC-type polysaccharide/polyol phosphate transport system ATPase subunit